MYRIEFLAWLLHPKKGIYFISKNVPTAIFCTNELFLPPATHEVKLGYNIAE